MIAEAWAAWVQAVGSILAIGAGFLTMFLQNRHADQAQEAERERRAEVVAYRLTGWIGEAGARIDRALRTCQKNKLTPSPSTLAGYLIPDLKLGMVSRIDGVLPDLHYLASGSGDIAQLDHLMRAYEAGLDRWNVNAGMEGPEVQEFYGHWERRLSELRALHANAERQIAPLVKQIAPLVKEAIEKGR
jgi:hypothetical protein